MRTGEWGGGCGGTVVGLLRFCKVLTPHPRPLSPEYRGEGGIPAGVKPAARPSPLSRVRGAGQSFRLKKQEMAMEHRKERLIRAVMCIFCLACLGHAVQVAGAGPSGAPALTPAARPAVGGNPPGDFTQRRRTGPAPGRAERRAFHPRPTDPGPVQTGHRARTETGRAAPPPGLRRARHGP